MDHFWKTTGMLLIGVILWIILEKQEKDISVLLSIALCCMGAAGAAIYLQPVIQFLWDLNETAGQGNSFVNYLFKAAGIGMISELTGKISADAGNASVSSIAKLLGSSAILYCGLPLYRTLISLIQEILGVI